MIIFFFHQEHVDSDFASHIQNAAEKFAGEIEELKEDISALCGDWKEAESFEEMEVKELGDDERLKEIEEEIDKLTNEIKLATVEFKVK